ncbi:MAG: HAD-IIA family hydrolase [Nocardioides sp.]|uniref:HAD-IIA family hydrolase n=1 Tax=Nocardioides sp. TaxID=35761 RepID=UPI0039E72B6D
MLRSCDKSLTVSYDLAMLDLDGVVYVGGSAVPHAPDALASARRAGMHVAFITNNASRPPAVVADQLNSLGIEADVGDVVTSAQAAAHLVLDRSGPGTRVAALGAEGLRDALTEAGLTPVGVEDEAEAIVTGYGPDVPWRHIMRAAVRIRDGLWWVATNTDRTIPTPYGTAPGNGVLVETIARFTGVDPEVAGKPERPLLEETIRRIGGTRPLMIGDRLDTDIAGATGLGIDSMLVLTGVSGLGDLLAAPPDQRPTYLAADLRGLHEPHPAVEVTTGSAEADRTARVGGWTASVRAGELVLTGAGSRIDWWRAAASAGWLQLDAAGVPAGAPSPPGEANGASRLGG